MNWLRKKELGNAGEQMVRNLLQRAGVTMQLNESSSYETLKTHDLANEGSSLKVECKNDVASKKYGNVCVEVRNSKSEQPSGIYATTSQLWAHIIYDQPEPTVLICRSSALRTFVEDENVPHRFLKKRGDNNADIKLYKIALTLAENGGPFRRFSFDEEGAQRLKESGMLDAPFSAHHFEPPGASARETC